MLTRASLVRLAGGACIAFHLVHAASAVARPLPRLAASSFAVQVLRYDPTYGGGCTPTNLNFLDPQVALGPEDYSGGASGTGAVALGSGGLIELLVSPHISNSGDARNDLRILEVGGFDEACFVALRPASYHTAQEMLALGLEDRNQDGFYEIKRIGGGSSYIELDRIFAMPVPAETIHFDAVQIVDDADDHSACTSTSGADIDYIEAYSPYLAVEPGTWTQVKVLFRD
jgi:hypothetical protein